MTDSLENAVAIVGVSAILPDAPDAASFWRNVTSGRYSISEVDPERWDPTLYYDADPKAREKTCSKIGGWVREWEWDPLGWRLPIPPKVCDAMDDGQKWGVACTRMALADHGWPERLLDLERTGVIIGNAMLGERHYLTAFHAVFPELARELEQAPHYAALPEEVRRLIMDELHANFDAWLPAVTADSMPGELGNCLAGRIANVFNLRGASFVCDAACASAMAAMDASIERLVDGSFDAVITGGIDRNMGPATFIKFCAIGALSGTGTRPFADGADGFVMGEGAALLVLRRLADAERDGDRIYAVVRGIGASSDGKGKGITTPNPVGQRLAVERAWARAGLSPSRCSLVEGHGTSTPAGDVAEVTSLGEAFARAGLAPGSVALGSVKSNIGHLKGAAGAAGMLKATLALHHKVLPPSLGFVHPNPNIDWSESPFAVNTKLREWEVPNGDPRVAAASAFGFGGTNFHVVLEEYVPGHLRTNGHGSIAVPVEVGSTEQPRASATAGARRAGDPETPVRGAPPTVYKPPLRGALVRGADDEAELARQLELVHSEARAGSAPAPAAPSEAALRAGERVAIDYGDAGELAEKAALALRALRAGAPAAWKALAGRGIFRGQGEPVKVAFLYTGQGSQYANMLDDLRRVEPIVSEAFDDADRIMRPLLDGRNLSDLIFVDPSDGDAIARAETGLMRTEITQPAVLTVDTALTRLLGAYGIVPDFVMGHSLGEYGALITAGVLPFDAALELSSFRVPEMANLDVGDPGAMVAVSAPVDEVKRIIDGVDGYVVTANINSTNQVVLGGDSDPVLRAMAIIKERGYMAVQLPVSQAFHTKLVDLLAEPLRAALRRMPLAPPELPVVANLDGEFYPSGPWGGGEDRRDPWAPHCLARAVPQGIAHALRCRRPGVRRDRTQEGVVGLRRGRTGRTRNPQSPHQSPEARRPCDVQLRAVRALRIRARSGIKRRFAPEFGEPAPGSAGGHVVAPAPSRVARDAVGAAPSSVGGDGARAQQHGNDADAELGHRFAEFVARSDSSWRRRVRSAQGRACDGMTHDHGDGEAFAEIDRRIHDRGLEIEQHPYLFDRRFLFRVLSMRH